MTVDEAMKSILEEKRKNTLASDSNFMMGKLMGCVANIMQNQDKRDTKEYADMKHLLDLVGDSIIQNIIELKKVLPAAISPTKPTEVIK